MLKNILNLEGVTVLSKTQEKNIFGGLREGGGGASVCKAVCNDTSIVTVSSCSASDAALGCSGTANGAKSCSCGHKGPLDPPGGY